MSEAVAGRVAAGGKDWGRSGVSGKCGRGRGMADVVGFSVTRALTLRDDDEGDGDA